MELKKCLFAVSGAIAWITMNTPENLNAIDVEMADELLYLLELCENDPAVKVVVLSGAGKAFSAGGDIRFLHKRMQNGDEYKTDKRLVKRVGQLALNIKQMGKLVITMVGGAAAGAGANLAFSGDFVFASEKTLFIQSFAGVGLVPDTGGAYLLSRIIGSQKALELCVLRRPVYAAEAKDLGLVYSVCRAEELEGATLAFAAELAAGPLLSYQGIKRQIFAASFSGLGAYLVNAEQSTMNVCVNSQDYKEGVFAFIEKRPPGFIGK